MPKPQGPPTLRLVLYMPPDLKQWLGEYVAQLKAKGEATDQSAYVCQLIDAARQELLSQVSHTT